MVAKEEKEKMYRLKLTQKRKEAKKRSQQSKKERAAMGKIKKIEPIIPDDGVEIEYIAPGLPFADGDPKYEEYKRIFEQFSGQDAAEDEEDEEEKKEEKPTAKVASKPKPRLEMENDSDDDSEDRRKMKGLSKRQKKLRSRMSVAKLKSLVTRPEVVEACDTTGPDPKFLVYLKAYRNSVTVPRHWSSKRRYLAGKRGVEKPPFKLPDYIAATGIQKIRQAIVERDAERTKKATSRMKLKPKSGKLDIDYQVLHDAFFKYATKGRLSKHNELYYEGKEFETQMAHKKPGQFSAALKEALGMPDGHPPPWLYNMQRYGPPPSYATLKIPGLNAPIPYGAEYGFHTGGWGKPPVDEFGQPLYGDFRNREHEVDYDEGFWGEMEDVDSDAEEEDMEMDKMDGAATPVMGTATPVIGSVTPVISGVQSITGTRSISGVSSITSGVETSTGVGSRARGLHSVSGVSSASMTPSGPQLFQVLEEQKRRSGGVFPTNKGYRVSGVSLSQQVSGSSTPLGIHTPGIATPGIHTPVMRGINTPGMPSSGTGTPGHATPGIATPGIATPMGGIATPIGGIATPAGGIITPAGVGATPMGGMDTPVNLNPSAVEAEGALTADIIRQQLKQHEEQAKKAREKAGQKETTKKKEKGKATKTAKKFKF